MGTGSDSGLRARAYGDFLLEGCMARERMEIFPDQTPYSESEKISFKKQLPIPSLIPLANTVSANGRIDDIIEPSRFAYGPYDYIDKRAAYNN